MTNNLPDQAGKPGFRYRHAPITEAVWDVRIAWTTPPSSALLEQLALRDDYPICKSHVAFETKVEASEDDVTTGARRRLAGYRFESIDSPQVVLAKPDGMTFSRRAPYESWSEFSQEAYRLWDVYRTAVASQGTLQRVALRYINYIVPPEDPIDIEKYLRTRPEISEDMPYVTTGYFLNLEIPLPAHDAVLHLVQTIVDLDVRRGLVLDIDVFQETSEPVDTAALRQRFETLRAAKNMVFEASITPDSRRLFQ